MKYRMPLVPPPYPWSGSKAGMAAAVWERMGDVSNYLEPFFGSGVVLLSRPNEPRHEAVNDINGFVVNFWRAVQADPVGLAERMAYPVTEVDLYARQVWLTNRDDFVEAMREDPEHFDMEVAAWWAWGASAWIGGKWCMGAPEPFGDGSRPRHNQKPHLGSPTGVHRHSHRVHGQRIDTPTYIRFLSGRMRRVRVLCGDWKRLVSSRTATWSMGTCGVFLDPPYQGSGYMYGRTRQGLAQEVGRWAAEQGEVPQMRIALCGYAGDYEMPDTWDVVPWIARGSHRNRSGNRQQECIWFSPGCLPAGEEE